MATPRSAAARPGGAGVQQALEPPALDGRLVTDVACGADHTVALDAQHNVWAWGRGEHGQLFGAANRPFTAPPTISKALSGTAGGEGGGGSGGAAIAAWIATAVEARGNCSCAVGRDGTRWCVGKC